ncbi:MAG TPA: hypothetical protein VFX15_15360 [Actinomycetes bacterium]|nr:hypothetical protein [Actinomycetes bacterium]
MELVGERPELMTVSHSLPSITDERRSLPSDGWFRALFDDAALFPPRKASTAEAVAEHVQWRASSDAKLVGPFVCSDEQWPSVRDVLPPGGLRIALTLPRGIKAAGRVIEEMSSVGVSLAQVESTVDPRSLERSLDALQQMVPEGVPMYGEIPIGQVDATLCERLVARSVRLKLRTGGTRADAFPPEEALASAIWLCSQHGLPFKLTAGLHGAVRHRDPVTGFEHHGFLNVLLATSAAVRGSDIAGVATILGVESRGDVAEAVLTLDEGWVSPVRAGFLSLGTCSIDEPLTDLRQLGLVPKEA